MVEIRHAKIDDSQEIKKLMLDALESDPTAFNVDSKIYEEKLPLWWENYLAPYFDIQNGFMLLLEIDSKLAGITAVTFDKNVRSKHNAHLFWVYISKEFRGKGFSTRLINLALEEIRKNKNIRKVSLDVNATQTAAINTYKKFGFVQCGYYKDSLLIDGKFIDKIGFELFI